MFQKRFRNIPQPYPYTLPSFLKQQSHMWQSWVEIEHYSVAYFDRVTTFEMLLRSISIMGGAHTCSEAASLPDKST